ncbi:MAG: MOSC domain-containing protein [Actinobacteria bacterium]|nr:MOSC domain-containing protein [Actinomycetota bacterium]
MRTVARLNVTPVKSTALHQPDEIRLEPYGAAGNREFFFVDEDGRMFTGSKHGSLVRIRAEHDPDRERITLRFPDGIVVEGDSDGRGEALLVDFYGRAVPSHVVEGPWGDALSRFAGRDVRLVRADRPGDGIDVHPVTLVSTASVEELSRHGDRDGPVDPRRFRMLVEVDGCTPHEEDTWEGRRVRLGDAVVLVGDPVPRCVVTTQDPDTGRRDFPTLRVIKEYRGTTEDQELVFGVYGEVVEPGIIRVGDPVDPLL